MELVPLASAALGVLGGIVRLLNAGVLGGKGGRKEAEEVKLTLTPPLFERHRDRNAFVRSPLDAYDLHRQALFGHFFADGHAVIATAQLQPTQFANYHDVEALIRVPSSAVSLFPFSTSRALPSLSSSAAAAALPSSSLLSAHGAALSSHPASLVPPPSYAIATASASPIADAVIRVQPSPSEPTFLQVTLSTANGGVAHAIGCYSLPALTSTASKPSASVAASSSPTDSSSSLLSASASPPPSTSLPLPSSPAASAPHAAVFFQAPLFTSEQRAAQLAREESLSPEAGGAVGVRVDHLGSSLGVSVNPLNPSRVSGWLSSSAYLSSTQNTALRGGCSFRADTAVLSSSLQSGAVGFGPGVQVDGKLSYLQMVDVDVDSASSSIPQSPVPAYEVGVTLRNGGEELITSFFNHLTVRRRVYNWWEAKNVVGVHNYVDVGMELSMKKTQPPSWRVAAAWQLNKSLLLKARLSDVQASAAVAVKSWHSPNTTLSVAAHYHYAGQMNVGLTFALENVGAVLFGRAPVQYRRTINARKKDVTYEWQHDTEY